jgi:hypothetical protein
MPYTRQQIVETARRMIDTRFQHQARVPYVAVDCIGLLIAISRVLGVEPHDFGAYGRDPDPEQLLQHTRMGMDEIPVGSAVPGDAYLIWWTAPDKPQHFVIKTGDDTIIHTHARIRRVREQTMPAEWRSKIHSAWAFKEVA